MEEPAQVNIFPQADASSYISTLGYITSQMSQIHGDVNDPSSGGPYKMSDFFGFSHVDIGNNAAEVGGNPQWIEYNIDGVTEKNSEVDILQKYFKTEKFTFKIKECMKLNELEYVYGNTIRRFKNRYTVYIWKRNQK